MSSTGMLILLIAIFVIFNADKFAGLMTGEYKLNLIRPIPPVSEGG